MWGVVSGEEMWQWTFLCAATWACESCGGDEPQSRAVVEREVLEEERCSILPALGATSPHALALVDLGLRSWLPHGSDATGHRLQAASGCLNILMPLLLTGGFWV